MSRTVRTLDLFRTGLAGAAAVVLLTACGGGGSEAGSATATPAAGQSGEGTAAADGAADFCAQAAGIDQRVDSALSDLEGDDPSVTDAFRQIATELRGIEAPDAISSDWEAMAAGLDRMADAFAGIDDITDLDSLEALDRAEGDLTTASTNVDAYLSDECGL
jgi:ABC-type glycerol-3-phosphate transport system substrate-binding protein